MSCKCKCKCSIRHVLKCYSRSNCLKSFSVVKLNSISKMPGLSNYSVLSQVQTDEGMKIEFICAKWGQTWWRQLTVLNTNMFLKHSQVGGVCVGVFMWLLKCNLCSQIVKANLKSCDDAAVFCSEHKDNICSRTKRSVFMPEACCFCSDCFSESLFPTHCLSL